ncbi:MAG: PHP domain-containing protein [Mogibacterium sp.]|nr:PHP domain-containing protein [Mogibacterium sp.]
MQYYPIDLHMHTTVSDGTDSPAELLSKVRQTGLKVFAVTDHDAVQGCREILQLLEGQNDSDAPRFLPGVEFSCRDGKEKYHILGYGYDPNAESIQSMVEEAHSIRLAKVRGRLAMLRKEHGVTFTEEELDTLFRRQNPGKPHIGNLIVRKGYAKTLTEAMNWIHTPENLRKLSLKPDRVIAGILESGGIPVLAHPSFGSGDQFITGKAMEERVQHLTAMGLQGLEVFYSKNTPELTSELVDLASRYDLYVTAGSDYHGKNKPVKLGETGLPEWPVPYGLREFLRAAGVR